MITDRRMLWHAARAAGYKVEYDRIDHRWHIETQPGLHADLWPRWRPLDDDGDAFRLAVALKMRIQIWEATGEATADWGSLSESEPLGNDPEAATRHVIVRLAAQMPKRA